MSTFQDEAQPDMPDSGLLAANGLLYKMPQSLSTTVSRVAKKQYSQKTSYSPGKVMIWDCNTGSDYVNPDECVLVLPVTFVLGTSPTLNDTVTFGTGSAANLIEEIVIKSKNGTELERIQHAHYLAKIMIDTVYSDSAKNVLQNAGYGVTTTAGGSGVFAEKKFVIPMGLISGFFRPLVKGQKIDGGLAAGLRIEMTLAPAARALTRAGTGTVVTYSVADPYMLFSCSSLNDPTQATLMRESSVNGLEYSYPTYHATPEPLGAANSLNTQVKRAVAQAFRVFTVVYDNGGGADVSDESNDGFLSIPSAEYSQHQYRVGNMYFPNSVCDSSEEAFYHAQNAFDKARDLLNNPGGPTTTQWDTGGKFLIASALERDSRLNLSGQPLNNSNVLELRLTLTGGGARDALIFIEYAAVARTRINSSSLKI